MPVLGCCTSTRCNQAGCQVVASDMLNNQTHQAKTSSANQLVLPHDKGRELCTCVFVFGGESLSIEQSLR
jgi:hypothetical protein